MTVFSVCSFSMIAFSRVILACISSKCGFSMTEVFRLSLFCFVLVWFYGISTLVDYLMPNPFLYT